MAKKIKSQDCKDCFMGVRCTESHLDVSAQIRYINADDEPVNSDLPTADRALLHSALDEWLDKADGNGYFFIGDRGALVIEFGDW